MRQTSSCERHQPAAAAPPPLLLLSLPRPDLSTVDTNRSAARPHPHAAHPTRRPDLSATCLKSIDATPQPGSIRRTDIYPIADPPGALECAPDTVPYAPYLKGPCNFSKTISDSIDSLMERTGKPVWFAPQTTPQVRHKRTNEDAHNEPSGCFYCCVHSKAVRSDCRALWKPRPQALCLCGQARLPSVREERAMVYSAIAHGATGIMWFALDPRSSGNPHSIPETWTACPDELIQEEWALRADREPRQLGAAVECVPRAGE